jgi:glycosyltransferase involved in cell wall biosynthesis
LLVIEAKGELADQVPAGVNMIPLPGDSRGVALFAAIGAEPRALLELAPLILRKGRPRRMLSRLRGLGRYLRSVRPTALFTAMPELNVLAALARRRTRTSCRLVMSERTHLSTSIVARQQHTGRSGGAPVSLLRRVYADADAVIAVSDGVADDLAAQTGLPRTRFTTVYNPVITPDFAHRRDAPIDDPWFTDRTVPVVLSVGRLSYQKDHPTLLRAFSRVRARRPARLVIIGAGVNPTRTRERTAELTRLAEALGVAGDVRLLGFVSNPVPFMARASVFVLSSTFEGFGNVLVEALGAGCPVVATDCPSGPAEILDHGRYGWLVPVGDDAAMAESILAALDHPPARGVLMRRAAEFDLAHAMDRYVPLLLGEDAGPRS